MSIARKSRTPSTEESLLSTSLSVAPAVIGCAVGLVLADSLKSESRRGLAATLFTLGTLAALPVAIAYAEKAVNNPARDGASQRRLRTIRDAGMEANILSGDEYFPGQQQEG